MTVIGHWLLQKGMDYSEARKNWSRLLPQPRPEVMIVPWSWVVAVEWTPVRCFLEMESAGWTGSRRWRSWRSQLFLA